MDHAEAFSRLQDAFMAPGKLRSIETDDSAEGLELRHHLGTCEPCRAELRALRLTGLALAAVAPDTMRAPVEARSRVLSAVAATGVARAPVVPHSIAPAALPPAALPPAALPPAAPASDALPIAAPASDALPTAAMAAEGPAVPSHQTAPSTVGRIPPPPPSTGKSVFGGPVALPAAPGAALPPAPGPRSVPGTGPAPVGRGRESSFRYSWVAAAAAAAVVLFVGGALFGGTLGLTPTASPKADLAAVVNATDHILQQPGHVQLALQAASGQAGGSMLLDPASEEIVVLSQTLQQENGAPYDCYAVRNGQRTWIGPMFFELGIAYWAGTVKALANFGRPGDVLEVRHRGTTDAPALTATFAG